MSSRAYFPLKRQGPGAAGQPGHSTGVALNAKSGFIIVNAVLYTSLAGHAGTRGGGKA